ncbi:cell division protein FtsL [Lacicoccus alkaliphilus]|uniref:Cell division protein FtsL n=1 Tax=Lacicoccus alkaliphilus DSM 16010 TaxID=1123231 RepID=A0A1M7CH03_9BACL|nr:cell division protein FtsL [Salinicoccus alkaliphilus]SHL66561.1 cell division protein FtsL [Salinicoccus alkaliphilus DSM 16010]
MAVERYRQVAPETKNFEERQRDSGRGTRTKRKIVGLRRTETMIYLVLMFVIALTAVVVLSLRMEAYQLQSEITNIENEIATTNGEIDELNTEVTHLASYDRIYEKAGELGLELDNGNVKVVERHGEN